MSQKIKQHFYISDKTKTSPVRANIPGYNKRLYGLKRIQFKVKQQTVAMCKRLTRICTNIYYIYDVDECIYLYLYGCLHSYITYMSIHMYIHTSIPTYMNNLMGICIHPCHAMLQAEVYVRVCVCPTLPNHMQLLINVDRTHPLLALLKPYPLYCDGRSASSQSKSGLPKLVFCVDPFVKEKSNKDPLWQTT